MHIVALAWIYVVLMMAVAEALSSQGTLIGAFFTLLLYGVLPLSIVLYVLNTPARKQRLRAQAAAAAAAAAAASAPAPDGSAHAAADPVAPKREEP